GLTEDELCIAQNEIWARHGRKFKNNWLQEYFDGQSWYHGTVDPDDFTKQKIGWSDVEEANAKLISDTLSSKGYDVNAVHPN
ncbi:MAG: YARHG domain-containing protein, partial [Phoenicibacter congonensis]|nr:YARHG domain-containing protein [Phoenicibacter congonensis]